MALGPDIRVSTLHSPPILRRAVAPCTLRRGYAGNLLWRGGFVGLARHWRGNAVRDENAIAGKGEKSMLGALSEEDEDCSDGSEQESSGGEEDFGFGEFRFAPDDGADEGANDAREELDSFAERARRIDDLCAKVAQGKQISSADLIGLYSFRLDKFQRLAIEGFLKGSSVVVSAPTSSGKTLIAEAAAAATLAKCKRLFYTTPLKALSNQKFRDFRKIFGDSSVGLLTGDVSINRDAPIVIMTTEIMRNKFYLSAGNEDVLQDLDVVVLDEIHYISDLTRGTVWEETVIYCPKRIKLVCLSATIANPDELAGWIAKVHGPTELITSYRRPVPLTWHISRRSQMLPLLNEKGTAINRKLLIDKKQLEEVNSRKIRGRISTLEKMTEEQLQVLLRVQVFLTILFAHLSNSCISCQVPRISDTLKQMVERNMLPAIWFILSRRRCDEAVQYLQHANLLAEDEFQQIDLALKSFREQYPDAIREAAVRPLYQGVAAHHAGCLPLWKSFIEELFQKGLVKVVFATETLAAGINMPARTTVLSSFSGKYQRRISANVVLQMAGRAGRRGIDKEGHVVVVQTPFRGPEECYKMLRTGLEPLVSQFTATYGMALNLLEDSAVESETLSSEQRQSFGEARSLIEQSFGNYIGSEILTGARAKMVQISSEIETLESGQSTDSLSKLYEEKINEFNKMREKVETQERKERSLRFKFERHRLSFLQSQLKQLSLEQVPYVLLTYEDINTGEDHTLSVAVFHMTENNPFILGVNENHEPKVEDMDASFIGVGCDSFLYRFPLKVVRKVYRSTIGAEERTALKSNLADVQWEIVGNDNVSRCQLSFPPHGYEVPVPNNLTSECAMPEELVTAEKLLLMQQRSLGKWSRRLAEIDEVEIDNLVAKVKQMREEKVARLKAKLERIGNRIKGMQPSGWKEFLQVVKILKGAGAMDRNTHKLLPLGEIARAIRGSNELWLAIALRDEALLSLKPSELAAVAAALVTESPKSIPDNEYRTIYEPSAVVKEWVEKMQSERLWLYGLQENHNVEFACDLDPQLAGFVEAWAAGVNWKELEIEDIMDEGDFARLLRRTIDLLSQIPHLPHIDSELSKIAKEAARNMDRPPISEPVGE
ncbi:DExH-box ATP-dependent RNA helicase DExH15 chloroplastic-like isoform X1 [Selaginella moellendorffii]|uniref:DExH-box ATP-dependent RNA helicase DExH15 chloroplastic-like isoform X1 n=1 Tax=Selaginella moellendorffii TaxID=88036 RepID=UPI000D1C6BE3|nr:DExH-box ATP-dependent RNA helicase DExH15 chloroplastic-like isoform X1 [Selaginella moellendorffii]|eukprot:XP_024542488.1 DExH-box ATP-dependent RNA helicase DExH15 chloroplastic-like isoform X1 [Selaginella moellendorffii]